MKIAFEKELVDILYELRAVIFQRDCEKVILYHIKKQFEMGFSEEVIIDYIEKLSLFLDNLCKSTEDIIDQFNYRHAAIILNFLQSTPYWRNWIKMNKRKIINV